MKAIEALLLMAGLTLAARAARFNPAAFPRLRLPET